MTEDLFPISVRCRPYSVVDRPYSVLLPIFRRLSSVFRRPVGVDLAEDTIHDPRGEQNLAIGNWRRAVRSDTVIESLNQLFHSEILVEPSSAKIDHVDARVSEMFARGKERRNNIGQVALIRSILYFEPRFRRNDLR